MREQPSSVYFTSVQSNETRNSFSEKLKKLFDRANMGRIIREKRSVAIKAHFGEKGNSTFLKPDQILPIIEKVRERGGKPYLTETSVLYKGPRSNALDHIELAYRHGFTYERLGVPIIMADGFLGVWEREIEINGEFYDKVSIAGDAIASDALLILSHVTGHLIAGFGAAIKNMGMGLSSRKGKLNQHSDMAPTVERDRCEFCKICLKWCPESCVVENEGKAFILAERCVGCGECIALCKQGAISFSWHITSEVLQKKMAEHAYGLFIEKKGKIAFINYLVNMTKDCDCIKNDGRVLIDDIGILASFDPVALDMASLDLTQKNNPDNLGKLAFPKLNPLAQLDHAEKLGMGTKSYTLIEV